MTIDWLDESNTRYRRIISINSNAVFYFYSGFYHDNEIHKYTHANVGFDKTQQAIFFSFRKFDEREKIPGGSFKITKDSRGTSGKISASALFKRNNLNVEEHVGKYPYYLVKDPNQGTLFYIKLEEKNKIDE